MAEEFSRETEERLLRYAAIDTQSDESSASAPSTACQFDLLNLLVAELTAIGAADVRMTGYGAVLATIPGTAPAPTIAFLAHVDTAPQFRATGVRPVVHRAYDGGTIRFADAPDLGLSPEQSPYLAGKVGDDIVTASGTTLLGADDKAGIAIVMTAARHLLAGPGIAHGPIRIAFTPDEEIGRGVHADLPGDLGAGIAYTFDGGDRGEIAFETFSADRAVVRIAGVSIHPGWAEDKLVNALHLAARIIETLPQVTRTARDHRWPRGLHPPLRDVGHAPPRPSSASSSATSSARASPPTAPSSARSPRPSPPPSLAPGCRSRSPPSTATCATGSRTTCAPSTSPAPPAATSASSRTRSRSAAAPTARG